MLVSIYADLSIGIMLIYSSILGLLPSYLCSLTDIFLGGVFFAFTELVYPLFVPSVRTKIGKQAFDKMI